MADTTVQGEVTSESGGAVLEGAQVVIIERNGAGSADDKAVGADVTDASGDFSIPVATGSAGEPADGEAVEIVVHDAGTQVESQHPWQEQFTQALGRLETREVEHVGAQLGAEVSGQRRAERRAILAPVGHRLDRAQFVLIDEERDGRGLPAKQRRDQDADDHRRADDRDRQQAEALDESADAA